MDVYTAHWAYSRRNEYPQPHYGQIGAAKNITATNSIETLPGVRYPVRSSEALLISERTPRASSRSHQVVNQPIRSNDRSIESEMERDANE